MTELGISLLNTLKDPPFIYCSYVNTLSLYLKPNVLFPPFSPPPIFRRPISSSRLFGAIDSILHRCGMGPLLGFHTAPYSEQTVFPSVLPSLFLY